MIDFFNRVSNAYYKLKGIFFYRLFFGNFGSGSILQKPVFLANPAYIFIGDRVLVRRGARLEVICSSAKRTPELRIGSDSNLEQNVHIVCHSRILIGSNVSITANCSIVDVTHPYDDVEDSVKIGARILDESSWVEIGDGAFLGIGTVVLPNVRIGKGAVIGANSVVTQDVPDHSVAAGNPAKVLRKYKM